jgi:outer membrane autotransporter protein
MHESRRLGCSLVGLSLLLGTSVSQAAQPQFQDFLFGVCAGTPTGDLAARCVESNDGVQDGNLSGDSEDSLTPTQALSNANNALAQTRARIEALLEKSRSIPGAERTSVLDEAKGTRAITRAFQMDGWSFLAQAELGRLERDRTLLERGYETDSVLFNIGADYRVSDTLLVGGLLGFDRYDQTFDPDQPGVNFTPQANEGDSRVTNLSLSVFAAKYFGDSAYVEGQASYINSDYRFRRRVVFQESGRVIPQTNVNTEADADGDQFAVSIGGGLEHDLGPWTLGGFARGDYVHSTIDAYQETGGSGLGMAFDEDKNTDITGTVGLRLSRAFNQDFGVLVPQAYVEHVHAFKADTRESTSRFLLDSAANQFNLTGDDPDKDYQNVGLSLLAILPNGVSFFLGYSTQLNNDYVDYHRWNTGLRVEL